MILQTAKHERSLGVDEFLLFRANVDTKFVFGFEPFESRTVASVKTLNHVVEVAVEAVGGLGHEALVVDRVLVRGRLDERNGGGAVRARRGLVEEVSVTRRPSLARGKWSV